MRTNIISWDEYFTSIIQVAAQRSKDPSTQVGAVIVDKQNRIISMGYNGFPRGIKETKELWERPTKYDLVVHAEMNAIINALNSETSIDGCKIYVPFAPCKNCAKHLAAAGIEEVIYISDYETVETSQSKLTSFDILDLLWN